MNFSQLLYMVDILSVPCYTQYLSFILTDKVSQFAIFCLNRLLIEFHLHAYNTPVQRSYTTLSITSTFCAGACKFFYLLLGFRNVVYVYFFSHQSSLEHSECFQSTDPAFSSALLNFLLVFKYCLCCICWFFTLPGKGCISMPGLLAPPPKCLNLLLSLYLFAIWFSVSLVFDSLTY